MKKIVSTVILVGLVGILVISNATVEAAKKRENVKQESVVKERGMVSVVTTREQENRKSNIKEKVKKETKSSDEKDEKVTSKENNKAENNIEKEDVKKEEVIRNCIEADGKVTKEDFAVIINDVRIEIGIDINEIIEQLGEPDDYMQARSCLHDGDDKIYTFGGIIIYTYPEGKKDIVYIVEYTGKEKTPSGIGLGSTMADLEEAYGREYVEDTVYTTYELDADATISFQLENQEVIYIEFYME